MPASKDSEQIMRDNEFIEKFTSAIEKNDSGAINELISERGKSNFNAQNNDGETPLVIAIKKNRLDVAEKLIQTTDYTTRDKDGNTALTYLLENKSRQSQQMAENIIPSYVRGNYDRNSITFGERDIRLASRNNPVIFKEIMPAYLEDKEDKKAKVVFEKNKKWYGGISRWYTNISTAGKISGKGFLGELGGAVLNWLSGKSTKDYVNNKYNSYINSGDGIMRSQAPKQQQQQEFFYSQLTKSSYSDDNIQKKYEKYEKNIQGGDNVVKSFLSDEGPSNKDDTKNKSGLL